VWLLDGRTVSDEKLQSCIAWLNTAEAERYARFVRPLRQRQFLMGRILLRLALSKLLDVAPGSIALSERRGQAPLLNFPSPAPGFSLSHSGPWLACAVSRQAALGLDIEMLDAGRDLLALAEQVFDVDSVTLLKSLEGDARTSAFYRMWSKKEAAFKLVSSAGDMHAHTITLSHAEMAIVLCSSLPVAEVQMQQLHTW
jgi:4'-phosphopantetheinyl transferase